MARMLAAGLISALVCLHLRVARAEQDGRGPGREQVWSTADAGLEYARAAGFNFVGARVEGFVAHRFSHASLGAALGAFGGTSAFNGDNSVWSVRMAALSLGPAVSFPIDERMQVRVGFGFNVAFLDTRSCYDAGDGCWYVAMGHLDLPTSNESVSIPIKFTADLWRTSSTVLFGAALIEPHYFMKSFSNDTPDYRPWAAAAAFTVGARY
jgi:hypothetical protein